jgi:hypothetical protein
MHPDIPIPIHEAHNVRFLLASLHLDRILECSRAEDVNHHLMNPPKEVNALYDQAWDRATGDSDSRKSQRAKLILMWVTCAKTGLTVRALGQALSFSGYGMNDAPFTSEEIVSSCAGLVRVEPMELPSTSPRYHDDIESIPRATDEDTEKEWQNSSVIAPIHLSARRYLETKRETLFPRADSAMIATCFQSTGPNGLIYATPRIYFIIAEYVSPYDFLSVIPIANLKTSLPLLALYICILIRDASQEELTYQLCSFAWICFMGSMYPYLLRPILPRKRVAVPTLEVYAFDYLESHITIWDPTMLAQICFTLAKSYVFYLRASLVWLVPVLIMAKSTREQFDKKISVLFLVSQLGSAFIFILLCLLFVKFGSFPWWFSCRVCVLAILLNVHVGLCLTRSVPALRGATDGVSFVHLLLNLHALLFGGLVA